MKIETIRRVGLARYLFDLGSQNLRSSNDLHLFAAVNLMQDALEAFLIAVADHLGASFDPKTTFERYLTIIETRISPRELPLKTELLLLNRVRVGSKHHGLQPARQECLRLAASARAFMQEVSIAHLGAPFATISAIDLLEEGEAKRLLSEAKTALDECDYRTCVISCRKTLYVEIESRYNIVAYLDGKPKGLLEAYSRAPYFTRNKQYIDEHVHEPTDYIVLDHNEIDRDLLKSGVDPTSFWNLWRLTPDVYRYKDGRWLVKEDFAKLDDVHLTDTAEYIFVTTLDLTLALHTAKRALRVPNYTKYHLELAREGVSIFVNADRMSKIAHTVPAGVTHLDTDYFVDGLHDDGVYWHISHLSDGLFLWGYVHQDDVKQ